MQKFSIYNLQSRSSQQNNCRGLDWIEFLFLQNAERRLFLWLKPICRYSWSSHRRLLLWKWWPANRSHSWGTRKISGINSTSPNQQVATGQIHSQPQPTVLLVRSCSKWARISHYWPSLQIPQPHWDGESHLWFQRNKEITILMDSFFFFFSRHPQWEAICLMVFGKDLFETRFYPWIFSIRQIWAAEVG